MGAAFAECPKCGERLHFGRAVGRQIRTPSDFASIVVDEMSALEREELRVALLNTRNGVIAVETVYVGNVSASLVRIGELFTEAVRRQAAAILICHNHPSGDPTPSPDDLRLTAEALAAGRLLDIAVLDHIVIGGGSFVSLRDRGIEFDQSGRHRAGEASRMPPWRDPWLGAYKSALQKRTRRGEVDNAVAAAGSLAGLPGGRTALARRLTVIAAEDVGIGWIPAVGRGVALEASSGPEVLERLLAVTASLASLPKCKEAYWLADTVWIGRHKPREVSAPALRTAIAEGDHREALAICLAAVEQRIWRSGPRLIETLTASVANAPDLARQIVRWALWRQGKGGSGSDECTAAAVIAAIDRPDGPVSELPTVTYEPPDGRYWLAWDDCDSHTAIGSRVLARHARRLAMSIDSLGWLMFNEQSIRLGPLELPSRWKDEALALDARDCGWGTPEAATGLWKSIGPAIRADIERELGRVTE